MPPLSLSKIAVVQLLAIECYHTKPSSIAWPSALYDCAVHFQCHTSRISGGKEIAEEVIKQIKVMILFDKMRHLLNEISYRWFYFSAVRLSGNSSSQCLYCKSF